MSITERPPSPAPRGAGRWRFGLLLLAALLPMAGDSSAPFEPASEVAWLDADAARERLSLWQGPTLVIPGEGPLLGRYRWPWADGELLVAMPERATLAFRPKAPGWAEVHVDGVRAYGRHTPGVARVRLDVAAGIHRLRFYGGLPAWVKIAPADMKPMEDSPPDLAGHPMVLPPGYRVELVGQLPAGGVLDAEVRGLGRGFTVEMRCSSDRALESAWVLGRRRLRLEAGRCGGEVGAFAVGAQDEAIELSRLSVFRPREPADETTGVAPRHVVLWVVDTLRADRLRPFHSATRVVAPGLEALASEATVYTSAYAASNWTKPSTSSLLTGWMPWEHGANTHEAVLSPTIPLLSEALRPSMRTAAFVANGYISERFGFERGWDHFAGSGATGRGTAAEMVEDALDWIGRVTDERRAFVYLHSVEPHFPYSPPQEILARYGGPGRAPIDVSDSRLLRRIETGEVSLSDGQRRELVDRYEAEIELHDQAVEQLIGGLRRLGILDETLVVLTSDHGEELFDHGSVNHGGARLFEELVHVPLVVRWPGVGERVDHSPVGHADLHRMILRAAGGTLPGAPLTTSWAWDRSSTPPFALSSRGRQLFSVVGHGHKLQLDVRDASPRSRVSDLHRNPLELPEVAGVAPHLTAELLALALLSVQEGRSPAPSDASHVAVVDGQVREQLRRLGYVE